MHLWSMYISALYVNNSIFKTYLIKRTDRLKLLFFVRARQIVKCRQITCMDLDK